MLDFFYFNLLSPGKNEKRRKKVYYEERFFFHDIDHEVEKEFEKNLRIAY